jgi:hypothetical protein
MNLKNALRFSVALGIVLLNAVAINARTGITGVAVMLGSLAVASLLTIAFKD